MPLWQVKCGTAYPTQPWLRWWDLDGNLLLTGNEEAEVERQRATQAQQQAEQERQKREQLVEQLRAISPQQLQEFGIDPSRIK